MRKADLADVAKSFMELKPATSDSLRGCCPFHHEKSPSFFVNTAKQVYHCFGCGTGGNIVTFVKGMVNTDYVGAMRWLAQRYNITIAESNEGNSDAEMRRRRFREAGMKLLEDAAGWFQSNLTGPAGAAARAYLASRGIDAETIQKYRIGYAPESRYALIDWAKKAGYSPELLTATGLAISYEDNPGNLRDRFRNRLMFTVCDELSRVVAFSGRIFGDQNPSSAKYVNSPESEFFHKGEVLYGFNFARQAFRKTGWALVCEGQLDVIACHRAGLTQAMASQGTAFTEEHCRMLQKSGVPIVHLAFDGDAAGHKATIRTIKLLQAHSMQVLVTTLPAGEDPDSIFRTGGAAALQQIMGTAESAVSFAFRAAMRLHHNGNTPEERSAIVDELLEVIASMRDDVARIGHCQWLAKQLQLPEKVLSDLLTAKMVARDKDARRAEEYSLRAGGHNPVPSQPVAPPAFKVPLAAVQSSGISALLEVLFDLAVHFQPAAEILLTAESLTALPETPVAQALALVLAGTANGEWEESVANLAQSELSADSAVSGVLTTSQFGNCSLAPDGTLDKTLNQALNDCLSRYEVLHLEEETAKMTQYLAAHPDDFDALVKSSELARRLKELKNRQKGL